MAPAAISDQAPVGFSTVYCSYRYIGISGLNLYRYFTMYRHFYSITVIFRNIGILCFNGIFMVYRYFYAMLVFFWYIVFNGIPAFKRITGIFKGIPVFFKVNRYFSILKF